MNESLLPLLLCVRCMRAAKRLAPALLAVLLLASGSLAWPQAAPADSLAAPVQQWVRQSTSNLPAGTRVDVDVGAIDSRLKLAPCAQITPYLPAGMRLWGRTQVGLRCMEGARWSVFVPVTVKVFVQAWTAAQPLSMGTVLTPAHLQRSEVDVAAEASPVVASPEVALGRSLARALRPGQALREADLKPRQWFAAGDTVRVTTIGSGFSISAEGQALAAGIEGQSIKVRTEAGRVVQGRATGARQVEVTL